MKSSKTLFNLRNLSWVALIGVAFSLFTQTSNAYNWTRHTKAPDIVSYLENDGRFTTLLTALEVANLKETLATGGPFTLMAPTDEAFAQVPADLLEAVLADQELLTKVLLYHVLDGRQGAGSLIYRSTATTLEGNPILVTVENRKVKVNGNTVLNANRYTGNGIVHVVDGVLLPPDPAITINSIVDILELDGRFTTLLAALEATDLKEAVATLPALTLFAPTDEAFAALPEGTVEALLADPDALANILLYHVLGERKGAIQLLLAGSADTLQGDAISISLEHYKVWINESTVLSPNVKGPNGIVHVIDAVLLPPMPSDNLVSLLENDGRFTTLLTALELTGLKDTVANGGPFTLFAPTDEAFAALPEGTLEALVADPDTLSNILLYHVVAGDKSASQLLSERRVTTLEGNNVYVWSWFGRVFVNRSRVIDANLTSGNGTVHAINRVLLPPTH
jgi:uncharacterized surface protein with fasciclin (FAS1) repeats